jgi:hypothetical protein
MMDWCNLSVTAVYYPWNYFIMDRLAWRSMKCLLFRVKLGHCCSYEASTNKTRRCPFRSLFNWFIGYIAGRMTHRTRRQNSAQNSIEKCFPKSLNFFRRIDAFSCLCAAMHIQSISEYRNRADSWRESAFGGLELSIWRLWPHLPGGSVTSIKW